MGAPACDEAQQLAFDFGALPTRSGRRSDNLFFAVLPEPDVARRMAEVAVGLRARHGLIGNPRPTRLLHVSLAGVGEYAGLPDVVVAAAVRAASMVRAAPFEANFDRAMSFRGGERRALVLRCGRGDVEFAHLRTILGSAMSSVGFRGTQPRSFAPHVTLLYDQQLMPEMRLAQPIAARVRELVLVHSLVGRGRHVHLGRWPLSGSCHPRA